MIKKLIIFLLIIICSITCNNHNSTIFLNNKHKVIYKRNQCDSKREFPQMILIPYFNQATQIVPNCKTYPIHETALALFIFYHQWVEYFGDSNLAVKGMLEKVMIEWDTKKRTDITGFDIKGKKSKTSTIIGLVKSSSMIWVWQGYHHRISESALIHELVHLALRAKNGTADPDHEGLEYRGWTKRHSQMIIETKQMLRAFEI
tara:strand:+ start:320 stop:928 length:609 start_codon:yes stop_codon:yes gene_type:complete